MATTRLDRLVNLLDTGSTPATRKAAAEHIGLVLSLHPGDLNVLLARVHTLLRYKNWHTRVAAAWAIEAMAKKIPQWTPPTEAPVDPAGGAVVAAAPMDTVDDSMFTFSSFNLARVITRGLELLGSTGVEYEQEEEELRKMDPRERLRWQRKQIIQQLNVNEDDEKAFNIQATFGEEDITLSDKGQKRKDRSGEEQALKVNAELAGMSARERNRALRLAKQKAKQPRAATNLTTPTSSGAMGVAVTDQQGGDKIVVESKVDALAHFASADEWPFQARCEELFNDLFDQAWEVRHGAAMGLRSIIMVHGGGAGKVPGVAADVQRVQNKRWLEDVAIRLVCVIALDRFGDFASDQVMAPVREICAQTLGAVLTFMDSEAVANVFGLLLQLQRQDAWEVRHGGLLGMKYLVAVRPDQVEGLLAQLLPAIREGLMDAFDDVRAASADALLPISSLVVRHAQTQVQAILTTLWDSLEDIEGLTASTSSVMKLLARMLAHVANGESSCRIGETHSDGIPLDLLVQRLWPFMRHNLTSVRRACLDAMRIIFVESLKAGVAGEWIAAVLPTTLTHLYQNLLVEDNQDIVTLTRDVWHEVVRNIPPEVLIPAATQRIVSWFTLLITPAGTPLDPRHVIIANPLVQTTAPSGAGAGAGAAPKNKKRKVDETSEDNTPTTLVIGGSAQLMAPDMHAVTRARIEAACALGCLAAQWQSKGNNPVAMTSLLVQMIKPPSEVRPPSCTKRQFAGVIISEWQNIAAVARPGSPASRPPLPPALVEHLCAALPPAPFFSELETLNNRMRDEVVDVVGRFVEAGVRDAPAQAGALREYNTAQADNLIKVLCPEWEARVADKRQSLKDMRTASVLRLRDTLAFILAEYVRSVFCATSSIATAIVAAGSLPEKITPLVKPLVDSVEKEEEDLLQSRSAFAVAQIVELVQGRATNPSPKIVANILAFLSRDTAECPSIAQDAYAGQAGGILTLKRMQDADKAAAAARARRAQSSAAAASAGAAAGAMDTGPDGAPVPLDAALLEDGEQGASVRTEKIAARGAGHTLTALASRFGDRLFEVLPSVWDLAAGPLTAHLAAPGTAVPPEKVQELINAIHLTQCIVARVTPALAQRFLQVVPNLVNGLQCASVGVRFKAARCLASMATVRAIRVAVVEHICRHVLPLLGDALSEHNRQGATECVFHLVQLLEMDVVPYLVILVIPILGRMSDFDTHVRLLISNTFAALMRLMPLEAGVPNPLGMSEDLAMRKTRDRGFLEQLLDSSKLKHHAVPVPIKADLRSYQQAGIDWMNFLRVYKLHGILCDDMGLGKTLQSICMLATEKFDRVSQYKETGDADMRPLPAIVVCPPTLTDHWCHEIRTFCDYLRPVAYSGTPDQRRPLLRNLADYDVIIMSYNTVRTDVELLKPLRFSYCILDEGHIIKNPKSTVTKAVKSIQAAHRLILSGTPIQNNVLELWSLFDFLMPGFLGTERQFNERYSKPIVNSKDAKASSREQEAGTLALESLHRQVLPFLLRRLKEDVLADLPPKIIQDYYCDLTALQRRLYNKFSRAMGKIEEGAGDKRTGNALQALTYMQRLCNHPSLFLTPAHPDYGEIVADLERQGSSLSSPELSGKLIALQQLLEDCGIGVDSEEGVESVVAAHRVLIFAQSKKMLDIIERDLFATQMRKVTYSRLDGDVEQSKRFGIVQTFNQDPSIDVLLVTTDVGGLGLNLTGADTVIFVEHDWNPTKDLQAMDRAHRLGQKRVVNVYRLITRDTLEEKIMNLQKFKQNIANTVISHDNESLDKMGTDRLLDLFQVDDGAAGDKEEEETEKQGKGLSAMLAKEQSQWDDNEYEQYDVVAFLESLKEHK